MNCKVQEPTGQPAARAGATLRVIMDMGKFQGVIAATTPTGCFRTSMRRFGCTVCSTSPVMRLASSANHSMDATLTQTMKTLQIWPFPYLPACIEGSLTVIVLIENETK